MKLPGLLVSFHPQNPSFSGISKVENMLWIQDIVESTLVLSFFIYFKIDMIGFVHPHKVVARIHFQFFQVHEMEVNWKAGQKV